MLRPCVQGPIYKSIEWLDREGMGLIEAANPAAFRQYLEQYSNTICGKHPIGVFLQVCACVWRGSGSCAVQGVRERGIERSCTLLTKLSWAPLGGSFGASISPPKKNMI